MRGEGGSFGTALGLVQTTPAPAPKGNGASRAVRPRAASEPLAPDGALRGVRAERGGTPQTSPPRGPSGARGDPADLNGAASAARGVRAMLRASKGADC